jgi:hypothetical protein
VLAPVALLLAPVFFAFCWAGEVGAWQTLSTFWQILAGIRNTSVEVGRRETSILIQTL